MTKVTTWLHDQQLEMLQLVNYSYEMTATCLGGEYFKDWLSMHYVDVENMPYVSGIHFKDLNILEHQDGNFYYTDRPRGPADQAAEAPEMSGFSPKCHVAQIRRQENCRTSRRRRQGKF